MANTVVPTMQELLEAGVHFGHKVSRGHPHMKKYIFGARDGVHIIDLAQSEEKLREAADAAFKMGQSGNSLLIVGTKKQAKEIVQDLAKEAGSYYLSEKWVGGLLTNFDEIRKNIKRLTDLKTQQEKGELSRYTKREQLLIGRDIEKFNRVLGGVATMDKLPEVIFVADAVADNTAIKEANKMGIKVVGLCDTNADPLWFDYPIPSNDDGIKAIKIICDTVIKSYIKGKNEAIGKAEKAAKEAADKKEAEESKVEETAVLDSAVAEEAAVIEEEVEKVVVGENARKTE